MATKGDAPTVPPDLKRLNQLAETQRWVHHVADLNAGKLQTTPLDTQITPVSRAQRLSKVRQRIDSSIFGNPFGGMSYSLTPKSPYQANGSASLAATNCYSYQAFNDIIDWWLPQVLPVPKPQPEMTFYFSVPQGVSSALLSISLLGWAWPRKTGHVRVHGNWGPSFIRAPIAGSYAVHTLDLAITVPDSGSSQTRIMVPSMSFESGIQWLGFKSVFFREPPPVLTQS